MIAAAEVELRARRRVQPLRRWGVTTCVACGEPFYGPLGRGYCPGRSCKSAVRLLLAGRHLVTP